MGDTRKACNVIGSVAFGLMALFPPWIHATGLGTTECVYGFLAYLPGGGITDTLYWSLITYQWLTALAFMAGLNLIGYYAERIVTEPTGIDSCLSNVKTKLCATKN